MVASPLFLPLGYLFLASRGGVSPPAFCGIISRASRNGGGRLASTSSSSSNADAISSLPPLLSTDGSATSSSSLPDLLSGKRVALYFAAGWCPMCTRFEPSLLQFRDAAQESGKPLEMIYVPSDRSAGDSITRASAMNMMSVAVGEKADAIKKEYKIWSGAESMKLGFGRRSGIPALVVLDAKGQEMAFVAAEAEGVKALGSWPLADENGVW